MDVEAVILVYDADGGLVPMLLDAVKKAVGREDCALCEIVYSPLGKRAAWNRCAARLGVPVEEMHRDEVPAEWGIARGDLPCVVARAGAVRPVVVMTRGDIEACAGAVEAFEGALRSALDRVRAS